MQHIDSEAVEIGVNSPANRPARSNPMQTPALGIGRNIVPVLIESGSASMYISQFVIHVIFAICLNGFDFFLCAQQVALNKVHGSSNNSKRI